MTDTVDKSIDEILRYFRGWVSLAGNSGEPMYKLGEYEQGELDEAKQAIKDLIATEVLHARRDEVERFLVEPGEAIPYNNNTFADGFRYVIDKLQARLAELEAQLGSK